MELFPILRTATGAGVHSLLIGTILMGFVLAWFDRDHPRMIGGTAVVLYGVYAVCELIVVRVYGGDISHTAPVLLGGSCLGIALGSTLCLALHALRRRGRDRRGRPR